MSPLYQLEMTRPGRFPGVRGGGSVSDGLDYQPGDLPSFICRFEPTSLISVLSADTTRLDLGATVSTSFTEPYNVAACSPRLTTSAGAAP